MGRERDHFPVRWIRRLFNENGSPNITLVSLVVFASVLQAGITLAASYIDQTWYLPDVGDGFLEHYGVWAILITDPLVLIAASLGAVAFGSCLNGLPLNMKVERAGLFRDRIVSLYYPALGIRSYYKFIYWLMVIVGLLAWVNNLRQTIDPISVYGNDVFDAWQYKWGFFSNKVNLFISWVIVYPLAGYVILSHSLCLRLILDRLIRKNLIQPRLSHPDGCFGCAKLGLLNVVLLAPYLLAFIVLFCLLLTHETSYFSVMVPLFGLSVIVLLISFVIIAPVTGLVRRAYVFEEERLTKESRQYPSGQSAKNRRFEFERVVFRA